MAKTVLIGCNNVKVPASVDIQLIGVENQDYDESHSGKTYIRESLVVSDSEVNCSVPATVAVIPRTYKVTSEVWESDKNTTVYFVDTGSIGVSFTVKAESKHVTIIKISNLNTLTVIPETGQIDGGASIVIDYLSPKDIYFDGTNFWSK